MAVRHKKTFKIYHNDQNIVPEGYVAIDELIAPTIQVLNQKGYTTRFCCSGHPLDGWLRLDSEAEAGYRESGAPLRSYIMFEEGIALPSLPPDFVKVETAHVSGTPLVIEKIHVINNASVNQYFEKSQKILETMKQLYQWALELPEFDEAKAEQEESVTFEDELLQKNKQREKEAFELAKRKISELGFDITLISAEYAPEKLTMVLYFRAENRVDLRSLVREIAGTLRMKTELRQIK